jgi:pyrimidine operon attenuation protein / uracil phosphoribosyltransferase
MLEEAWSLRIENGHAFCTGHCAVKLPTAYTSLLTPDHPCYPPAALPERRQNHSQNKVCMNVKKRLLDGPRMNRAIRRMAIEILEKNRGTDDLIIVGIRSRGVPIAERMAKEIEEMEGHPVSSGILDITLYRDDLTTIAPQPVVKPTKLPEPIDDKIVVLVDDVLYTGRTVRAALDALIDFGRPKAVMLAVLIDRGHRELPIHADVIGKTVPTDAHEVIKVKLVETDGEDEVLIMEK